MWSLRPFQPLQPGLPLQLSRILHIPRLAFSVLETLCCNSTYALALDLYSIHKLISGLLLHSSELGSFTAANSHNKLNGDTAHQDLSASKISTLHPRLFPLQHPKGASALQVENPLHQQPPITSQLPNFQSFVAHRNPRSESRPDSDMLDLFSWPLTCSISRSLYPCPRIRKAIKVSKQSRPHPHYLVLIRQIPFTSLAIN
jgi:hypothetical protein